MKKSFFIAEKSTFPFVLCDLKTDTLISDFLIKLRGIKGKSEKIKAIAFVQMGIQENIKSSVVKGHGKKKKKKQP